MIMEKWPQGNLTDNEWQELLGIEYTVNMYPLYYNRIEYGNAVARMQELRELKSNQK